MKALKTCGYPNWAFIKSTKMNKKEGQTPTSEKQKAKQNNIAMFCLADKLRRIFLKHDIPVHFPPSDSLRQKLVHPKDKTPKDKLNNIVSALKCSK